MTLLDTLTTSSAATARETRPRRLCQSPIAFAERMRRHSSASSNDSYSFYSAVSRQPSAMELLVSRLLDAFIFTSAIAITAYNYWTGNLDQPTVHHHPLSPSAPTSLPHRTDNRTVAWRDKEMTKHLDDARRQRTQEWTESIQHKTLKRAQSKPVSVKQERHQHKRRPRSVELHPPISIADTDNDDGKDTEMMTRMEEQVQALIQQGQAALTSTVEVYEMDKNEATMRKAFASNKRHNT